MARKAVPRVLKPRFTTFAGKPPAHFGRVVVDVGDYRSGRLSVDAEVRWILRALPRREP